jgi:hypothetical protein
MNFPLSTRPAAAAAAAAFGVAMLAACAGGGMYDQPYVLFEPASSPNADTSPAFVVEVDGVGQSINRNDPVAPGVRRVVLSVPRVPGMSVSGRETLVIDTKPCTRYYFSARHSSPTARDWTAYVSGVEPIGECRKKFGMS